MLSEIKSQPFPYMRPVVNTSPMKSCHAGLTVTYEWHFVLWTLFHSLSLAKEPKGSTPLTLKSINEHGPHTVQHTCHKISFYWCNYEQDTHYSVLLSHDHSTQTKLNDHKNTCAMTDRKELHIYYQSDHHCLCQHELLHDGCWMARPLPITVSTWLK